MSRKLPRKYVEKVWGADRLPDAFDVPSDARFGEVWFEPPPELPQLLAKYIFTSERLSVQNHPSDAQAEAMGFGRNGKSECWVILESAPDATIAVGFREEHSPEALRAAALDGSIVDLLEWHPVTKGDVFYIPSGTVHAIGAGVNLIEVQQNSDITFRLFDYGRPRELHLDGGLSVAETGPYSADLRSRVGSGSATLVDGPHFRLDCFSAETGTAHELTGPAIAIAFDGSPNVGDASLSLGDCLLVEDMAGVAITGTGSVLVSQPKAG